MLGVANVGVARKSYPPQIHQQQLTVNALNIGDCQSHFLVARL